MISLDGPSRAGAQRASNSWLGRCRVLRMAQCLHSIIPNPKPRRMTLCVLLPLPRSCSALLRWLAAQPSTRMATLSKRAATSTKMAKPFAATSAPTGGSVVTNSRAEVFAVPTQKGDALASNGYQIQASHAMAPPRPKGATLKHASTPDLQRGRSSAVRRVGVPTARPDLAASSPDAGRPSTARSANSASLGRANNPRKGGRWH